jgi:NADH-quinone oxidoreductase subunit J
MNPVVIESAPGTAEMVLFYILAGMTLGFALFAITRKNPVSAVMSLVATFVSLAAIYATLSAHFMAVLQILVYAGAIMVLFIFVVMILNRDEVEPVSLRGIITRSLATLAGAAIFMFAAVLALKGTDAAALSALPLPPPEGFGTVASVGKKLFTEFVFPFEAISILLLVAIVGGLVVSRSAKQEALAEIVAERQAEVRAMIREPAPPASGEDHGHGSGHGHDDDHNHGGAPAAGHH